jgi:hypothetical protein
MRRQRQAVPQRFQDREGPMETEKEHGSPFRRRSAGYAGRPLFMEKDSKKFPDTGGWAYAQFDFDPTSATFAPNKGGTANAGTYAIWP